MGGWRALGQRAMAALLVLSVAVWSVLPSMAHVPQAPAMIAEHGHAHGIDAPLFGTQHDHGPEALDHDHSQALAVSGPRSDAMTGGRDAWRLRPTLDGPHQVFRIERPPRG